MFDRHYLTDAAERLVWTFLETFAGVFGFNGLRAVGDHDWHTAAALAHSGEIAGLAAVAAAVKVILASRRSGTVSPASTAKKPRRPRKDAGFTAVGLIGAVLITATVLILFGIFHHPLVFLALTAAVIAAAAM